MERYREVQQAREKWGRGMRHRWERQGEITVHKIYLKVPKGINKVSELSFATMVAGFLGFFKNDFTSIFLGPIYLYDIFYASTL